MMNLKKQLSVVFVLLITSLSSAHADDAAETFVAEILLQATPVLNAESETEKFEGIAQLVDEYVDVRKAALFTIGQYARQISPEQKETFISLFRDYAKLIYQDALSNYSGQTLAVTGSVDRSERDIIVNSGIVNAAAGDPFANINVHWRVYRSRAGELSIVDAGADNIWLAIEQRSQFTSIIANNGGGSTGIDALIAQLRSQLGQ